DGRIDLCVLGNIHRAAEAATELVGHGLDARLELVPLVGERQLGALARHRLCDAPGDRALAREADDQHTLAVQKSHVSSPPVRWGRRAIRRLWHPRSGAEEQRRRGILVISAALREILLLQPPDWAVTSTCRTSCWPGCR